MDGFKVLCVAGFCLFSAQHSSGLLQVMEIQLYSGKARDFHIWLRVGTLKFGTSFRYLTLVWRTCVCVCVSRQLEYNNLTEVSKGWLYGLLTLQQLHLSHNAISRIKPDAWEFCQKLAELWVYFTLTDTLSLTSLSHHALAQRRTSTTCCVLLSKVVLRLKLIVFWEANIIDVLLGIKVICNI